MIKKQRGGKSKFPIDRIENNFRLTFGEVNVKSKKKCAMNVCKIYI